MGWDMGCFLVPWHSSTAVVQIVDNGVKIHAPCAHTKTFRKIDRSNTTGVCNNNNDAPWGQTTRYYDIANKNRTTCTAKHRSFGRD